MAGKVALVTGGARRIGATIARVLHTEGMTVVVHYSQSSEDAERLCAELNGVRRNSAYSVQSDLLVVGRIPQLVESSLNAAGRLDVLINNASSFYPTPIGSVTETVWNDLMGTNCKAPLFLAQAMAPHLAAHEGCIVNITDAYAAKPLKNHPVYCAAKAGLAMITRVLAHDLAPRVRVNAVAPGAILWPEHGVSETAK